MESDTNVFPRLRWPALVWLAVWLPSYWIVWGPANFLRLCDIAVILTCLGVWRGSALILSSQAVSSLVVDVLWCVDLAGRLVLGWHVIGGTEYMWDAHYPLGVRLLSLFHLALPIVYIFSLRRVGYHRRGWLVQSALAVVVMIVSHFVTPEANLNYALRDPLFHRAWGPAPAHLALTLAVLIGVIYWPTHVALARFLPAAKTSAVER